MTERVLYSVRLASVRTAPPGYRIPTCQGTLCQVTTERLIVPGATYGSETPLENIEGCEVILDESSDIKCYVAVNAVQYYMGLVCNNQQECEQLAEAIRQAARAKVGNPKIGWFLEESLRVPTHPLKKETDTLEQLTDIPEILPILPSTSTLVYPMAMNQLTIEDEPALRMLDDIRDSHRLLVVAACKSSGSKPTHLSDLFHVGTVTRLAMMRPADKGKREIALLGLERVTIGAAVQERPYLLAQVVLKPDLEVPEDASTDEIKETITVFEKLMARSQKMPLHEVAYHFEHSSLSEQVYTMAFFSQPDLERGQHLLELDSPAARLSRLKDFLTTELEQFDQEWQAAHRSVQERTGSKIELALDRLNTAQTLEDAFQVLTEQKSLLLNKKGLDALRSRIAHKRQQKATKRWIFLLTQDLDLLEKAHKHGLTMARGYLDALSKMRGSQQAILEAMKVLATLDVDDPETLKKVMERQETHPFSPETFAAMYALSEQMGDPESREQLQAVLHLLEDVQEIGKENAIAKHVHRRNPDIDSEIEHALDVLEQYLTSQSNEEAFLTLQQHQDILLSDMVEEILKQHIAERYSAGDQRSARILEMHLYLFEDARQLGLEAAWQTFIEDE